MRIAYACEGYADVRMLSALRETAQVTLLVPSSDWREGGLAERVRAAGLDLGVVELPSPRLAAVAAILAHLSVRAGRYDAVIALDIRGGALASALACRLRGRPCIVQVLTDPAAYWNCRPRPAMERVAGRMLLEILTALNGALAWRMIGMGTYYASLLGASASKYREVNLYGLDEARLFPADPRERPALRAALGLPAGPPLVFFPSRIAPEKGAGILLEASARVRADAKAAPFTLLHASGRHRRFADMARDAGVEAISIPALHPVDELPAYYRASDLCVQPSLAEGFGWAPREALACGVPVVVTDAGGMRGDFCGMGLSCPPGNTEALAARIREALAEPERMREMAMRGRDYVLECYGRERAVAALRAILVEAAHGS